MNDVIHKDLKKATEEKIKQLLEESQGDVNGNNLQALGDLVDIVKDIENIEYWYTKEEDNMYGEYGRRGRSNYGEYGRRGRDSYGRRERDSRGRYRGHDYLDDMYSDYEDYMDSYNRYGAGEDTKKSLKYMLESMEDFARMLKEDAQSQEEVDMIRQTAQRIANM